MSQLDLSGYITDKEQEDLPYGGDLIEKTELFPTHCDETFPLIKDMSHTFQQPIFSYTEIPQEETPRCANDTFPETSVIKKCSKELYTGFFHIPTNNEGLLQHLSKEEFSNAIQPLAGETFPELSFKSSDETILKSLILNCSENSLSRESITELHKRNDICSQSNHRQFTRKESIFDFDFEESVTPGDCFQGISHIVGENGNPNYLQTTCRELPPQKCLFERLNPDSGLNSGQNQDLPDFSQAPKIRIPINIHHSLATVVQQTNSSLILSEKPVIVQNGLETMTMNFLDRKPQENNEETTDFRQCLKSMTEHIEDKNLIDYLGCNTKVNVEPLLDVSERVLSGLASNTKVLKSTTELQLPSSPSQLLKKTTNGDNSCQELMEKTKNLKTKVEEFSKRINQDSTSLKDNKQVLEILKGYLDVLEQSYLFTKEKLQILQNHDKKSTAFGEFDPERKTEHEIFKVKMLLENVKEKMSESTPSSFLACSSDSVNTLDFTLLSFPNEVPRQINKHDHSEKSECEIKLLDFGKQGRGNSLIPFLKRKDKSVNKKVIPTKIQETPPQDCLCELYPQIYLGLPRRDATVDEGSLKLASKKEVMVSPVKTNQLAVKLSSDLMKAFSSLESDNDRESLESIKQSVLRQDGPSDHELSVSSNHTEYLLLKKDQNRDGDLRKQKKEKKNDSRKSKRGRCSVIFQEKALNLNHSDSTNCIDAGDSLNTPRADECINCRNKRHKSRKKEFHYKYNYPGQNLLHFNECDGFIRFCTLSKNASFTSDSTHQKWNENLVEQPKNEDSKVSKKSKPVCSQQKKHQYLRITDKSSQSQAETILAEKLNLKSSKSFAGFYDQIANSPNYHSCRISGSKALYSIQNINRKDSEINSALDYALRTAITLKETTEQMIQVIAKDLTKAQGRRSHRKF
ncbi:protein AKNAD1 isoform X2 [Macrotis lagotis]|uniref:protein AKNAD1 isoform X2 n=1 Tax=Macrotis lagotis TaxID=92651 RepID=UPI003D69C378